MAKCPSGVKLVQLADMDLTDDQIIERTLAGETEAFGLLVRRWENPIYGLSLRMLGRDEEARDVCQETFLAAFRNLRKFRGEAKFSSWIYRIALNACNSRLRRPDTNRTRSLDDEQEDGRREELADRTSEAATESLQREQLSAIVRKALNALPSEMRQVIVMKEYEELTFAEIAEILEIPVSTVKSRVYTGLQQLRARLEHVREAL